MGSEDKVRMESEYSRGYYCLFNVDKNCFFSFTNRPNILHLNVHCLSDGCALSSKLQTYSIQRANSTARLFRTYRYIQTGYSLYICQKTYFFHILL